MSLNHKYSQQNRQILLQLAKSSIAYGLENKAVLPVDLGTYTHELIELRASFVTLKIQDQLRGCIGMLKAVRPLVQDIAENAYAAAFKDPRFSPLQHQEYPQLEIHLSILDPAEAILFTSEQNLLEQLQPEIDGLILEEGVLHSTFLPSVWESLPDPQSFLQHLKQKAGLPGDYWSETLKVYRYSVESIP